MDINQFIYDQVRTTVRQELMAAISKMLDELEANLEPEAAVAALEPKPVRRRTRRRKVQAVAAESNGAPKPKRKRATKAEMAERKRLAAADSEETSPF
jgi:hypothetical protein